MWDFFSSLPIGWAITIIILLTFALVIIALRGKLKAKFGDKEIEIGDGAHDSKPDLPPPPVTGFVPPPPVTGSFLKRTCGDCVLILMGEREKFELQIRKERDRILKTQMVYAEQKMITMQTILIDNWILAIHNSVKDKTTVVDESVQHKLIYGLLKDAMFGIKDEIRRSFKDNGFYDLSSSEFSEYTKDRVNVINSMLNQHIRNIYPDRGGVLELAEVLGIMDKQTPYLSTLIMDIYYRAREVKTEAEEKINTFKTKYGSWVDSFINK